MFCYYKIRRRVRAQKQINGKDGMQMVSMESPNMGTISPSNNAIMRVSSVSKANGDVDVLNDMNIDIAKNVSNGHVTAGGTCKMTTSIDK